MTHEKELKKIFLEINKHIKVIAATKKQTVIQSSSIRILYVYRKLSVL